MNKPVEHYDVDGKLASLGIEINTLGVVLFSDVEKATTCYVHHSSEPTAAAAFAMAEPIFAKGRFPNYTLIQFLRKRPSMDEVEILAFEAVCGAPLELPKWDDRGHAFFKQLLKVIDQYELWDFFLREPPAATKPENHHCIRPIGFDYAGDWSEIPGALPAWRAKYRKLSTLRQMMVATVLTLYLQRDDKHWMVRVPKTWHVADAITLMRREGNLPDWARLVGLYPGW